MRMHTWLQASSQGKTYHHCDTVRQPQAQLSGRQPGDIHVTGEPAQIHDRAMQETWPFKGTNPTS